MSDVIYLHISRRNDRSALPTQLFYMAHINGDGERELSTFVERKDFKACFDENSSVRIHADAGARAAFARVVKYSENPDASFSEDAPIVIIRDDPDNTGDIDQ